MGPYYDSICHIAWRLEETPEVTSCPLLGHLRERLAALRDLALERPQLRPWPRPTLRPWFRPSLTRT